MVEAPASGCDDKKFRKMVKGAGASCKLLLLAEILATMLVAGLVPMSAQGVTRLHMVHASLPGFHMARTFFGDIEAGEWRGSNPSKSLLGHSWATENEM